jgi:hypothetical protein
VLAVAARAAIRSASPNRLRASKLTAGGGISATSSDSSAIAPSTSSSSISDSIEASESCAPLIDPAYSWVSWVTLNPLADGSTLTTDGVEEGGSGS